MKWVILEALVSLALGLSILWWALSPRRKRDRRKEARDATKPPSADEDVR